MQSFFCFFLFSLCFDIISLLLLLIEWPAFPRDFVFRENADTESLKCVLIYERADYEEWRNYFFCSEGERNTEMRWSDSGQLLGRWKCTNIFEPEEEPSKSWFDNYLCVPKNAPYNFTYVSYTVFYTLKVYHDIQ